MHGRLLSSNACKQTMHVCREVLVQWVTRDAGHPTVLYGEVSGVLLKVMVVVESHGIRS